MSTGGGGPQIPPLPLLKRVKIGEVLGNFEKCNQTQNLVSCNFENLAPSFNFAPLFPLTISCIDDRPVYPSMYVHMVVTHICESFLVN